MFKHGLSDKHLTRYFGKYKPKTMPTLMEIVTKFCCGEDEWYAKQKAHDGDPGMSGTKDERSRPKRNRKNKHKDYNDGDDQINAGFEAHDQGGGGSPKEKQWRGKKGKKGNNSGPCLDNIMDRPCGYHRP